LLRLLLNPPDWGQNCFIEDENCENTQTSNNGLYCTIPLWKGAIALRAAASAHGL
jgi:hypothetical protein